MRNDFSKEQQILKMINEIERMGQLLLANVHDRLGSGHELSHPESSTFSNNMMGVR